MWAVRHAGMDKPYSCKGKGLVVPHTPPKGGIKLGDLFTKNGFRFAQRRLAQMNPNQPNVSHMIEELWVKRQVSKSLCKLLIG